MGTERWESWHLWSSDYAAMVARQPASSGGQDGQRATEKFAVGRNPLLAAKRFKTLVEQAGNRWPEGWVPGKGFVSAETWNADTEPTPLFAFGLRYVDQLIIRPGQRARYRSQLKALAVLELPSPTMPGTTYLPFGRNVEDVTPGGRPALALTVGSGAQDEGQLPRPPFRRLRLGR